MSNFTFKNYSIVFGACTEIEIVSINNIRWKLKYRTKLTQVEITYYDTKTHHGSRFIKKCSSYAMLMDAVIMFPNKHSVLCVFEKFKFWLSSVSIYQTTQHSWLLLPSLASLLLASLIVWPKYDDYFVLVICWLKVLFGALFILLL